MIEQILVVPRQLIDDTYGESNAKLLGADEKQFKSLVQTHYTYMPRPEAEVDQAMKQVIAYCVVKSEGDILVMRRLKTQGEARLHNRCSIGVGGHINDTDATRDVVEAGLIRELEEEVFLDASYKLTYLGLINDNSSEVNTVHVGLCYLVEVPNHACRIRETEKMEGSWVPCTELRKLWDSLEGWSRIACSEF